MGIEIQDDPIDIQPLMPARSEQRRKGRLQRFKHRLYGLANDVIGRSPLHPDRRSFRHDRRSFTERRATDQKDHNNDAAYDE
jgi:hypothetical protein